MGPTDAEQILSILHAEGVPVSGVTRVSDSMFTGLLDGERRYLKRIPDDRAEVVQHLVEIQDAIGMPPSQLIRTEENVQIMQPAEGKPLSYILPLYTIPGIYGGYRHSLESGLKALGRYLGELHTRTRNGDATVRSWDLHFDKYRTITESGLNTQLEQELDAETVERYRELLDQYDSFTVPMSYVHGDVMLFHVYYSDDNVELIDFDRAACASIYTDLITFECALELMLRRLPWGSESTFTQLISAFRAGYADTQSEEIDYIAERYRFFKCLKYSSLFLYYMQVEGASGILSSFNTSYITRHIDMHLLKKLIRETCNRASSY